MNFSAILGPTNTGKTYFAVERMLHFKSGVIGFPLRLLARENYELAAKKVGIKKVGLITGEEKIIPETAQFFFCTVEAMPNARSFDFVAIDEIQLSANYERGHLFTEKILNLRGDIETLFLGSSSIKNLLLRIFPNIKIYKRPRFSELKYCGYKNLLRIPPRSAIIAFSQIDVYSIAEKIKKFKGGVSVVTGALTPEARNAQVKMFQNGEVDYIIATDAIGYGLNLAIKYIFFTSIIKFDGTKKRYLTYDEISQIAGRAGRYKNIGYFGITQNLKSLSNEIIEFVEDYQNTEIEKIYWRNSNLCFNSPKELLRSLYIKPKSKDLILKKDSSDLRHLKILIQNKKILEILKLKKNYLELLWEICGIPDYTKTLDEFHSRLLIKLFVFLTEKKKTIPRSWIEFQVEQIKKVTDKISSINAKISQIRIWSYVAFKKDWIEKSKTIQKKIKNIENLLSNKLHKNLINKFVDSSINIKEKKKIKNNFLSLDNKNDLNLNKKKIGKLEGFRFKFFDNTFFLDNKSHSYKLIKDSLKLISKRVVKDFNNSSFKSFYYDISGNIFWENSIVGKFKRSEKIFLPSVKIISDEFFLSEKIKLEIKFKNFLKFLLNQNCFKLMSILEGSKCTKRSSSFRALCFNLYENFGYCSKRKMNIYYKKLNSEEFAFFKNLGLCNGNKFFYFKEEKNNTFLFKQMLVNLFFNLKCEKSEKRKLIVVNNRNKSLGKDYLQMFGYLKIFVLDKIYWVHFSLYEKLIDFIYLNKKKKVPLSKKLLDECNNQRSFVKHCVIGSENLLAKMNL